MKQKFFFIAFIIAIALINFAGCDDVVNINLANLYQSACDCSTSTSTASCQSLNCSNDTEHTYCTSKCCVDQETCACTNTSVCGFSSNAIVASSFINGPLDGEGFGLTAMLRLKMSLNAAPIKFGEIQYTTLWTNMMENNVTYTIQDFSRNTLVSFQVNNALDKSTYNGLASGTYKPSSAEVSKLLNSSIWIVKAVGLDTGFEGESHFTKTKETKANVVAQQDSTTYYSYCVVGNPLVLTDFISACPEGCAGISFTSDGCDPENGETTYRLSCTTPSPTLPAPIELGCFPPGTDFLTQCQIAYSSISGNFFTVVVDTTIQNASGCTNTYFKLYCKTVASK